MTAEFLQLHHGDRPLLLPNPWDVGSARMLAWLGFEALATTSSGFAMSLGRLDGSVTRDEALAHAAQIVAATALPVSADLENGFGDEPSAVAETVRGAVAAGLAGCSIEDFTGDRSAPSYERALAVERVAAAVDAAHGGTDQLVLTARCEHFLHGNTDLGDTIERLQAFAAAGADVLYAPGLRQRADIAAVISAVDRPVNVLLMPDGPSVAELADLGVARISVGGAFAYAAMGALATAARELRDAGGSGFFDSVAVGRAAVAEAFTAAP